MRRQSKHNVGAPIDTYVLCTKAEEENLSAKHSTVDVGKVAIIRLGKNGDERTLKST